MTPAPESPPVWRTTSRAYHTTRLRFLSAIALSLPCAASALADGTGPRRIVSLSPLASEVVVALGAGDRLVAADPTSAGRPALEGLPALEDIRTLASFSPDLVIVPIADAPAARREAPTAETLEVDVHDFDAAWALCLELGTILGRATAARRFVREVSRPLAEISAASFGRRRPRVVAVVGFDPLEIAGGHGFVADWIELAGGENVTHENEAYRLPATREQLARAAPELALLATPTPPTEGERARARRALGPGVRIEWLRLPTPAAWLDEAVPTARQLERWIEAIRRAGPRETPADPGASGRAP